MPPEDDPGATDVAPEPPEPEEAEPDVPEPEVPVPDRTADAEEPTRPVVALPCAAPCGEPGSTVAMVPVAAALAITIAAVAAESRRMPRRLFADGARERPDEWAAIAASLQLPRRGCPGSRGDLNPASDGRRSGPSGVLLNRLRAPCAIRETASRGPMGGRVRAGAAK